MEKIRLSKYFTDCGVMSRRAADAAIERGEVKVNGVVACLGDKIEAGVDEVIYKGKKILPASDKRVCIMLNKPRGVVCTASDEKGRANATELCRGVKDAQGHALRLYPVGRLDMDSDGLLLLTNDGNLTNTLTHPRHGIHKIYRVTVEGNVSDEQLETLRSPLVIDDYEILPVKVDVTSRDPEHTTLKMTLYEGRNRQIRKMCEIAGLSIRRLCRVAIGDLKMGELKPGSWRYLADEEVEYLKESDIQQKGTENT
jgi:23S rRNA pseudouridine2605 synthase